MSNAHVRELRVDTLIARSLYELKLSMYIHCRRMQYDLVVLLHFSATHGPLFVIVFSKEQKKTPNIVPGFFHPFPFRFRFGFKAIRSLSFSHLHKAAKFISMCRCIIYTPHTPCVYLYTRKFIAFGRRQKMSVGVVCMHNERAKQYTLLHRIWFVFVFGCHWLQVWNSLYRAHTHFVYNTRAAPLQSIAVVRRSSDKEQDGEKGNSTWNIKRWAIKFEQKHTDTLTHK